MRILINRTDAIGDMLLTVPVVKLIKEHHPHAKVGMLASPRCRDLMPLIDQLDAYWIFDPEQNFFSKWQHLAHIFRGFSPDTYLYVSGTHWASFYAYFKSIPRRAGLLSRWPSFLFLNQGVRQSRGDGKRHESLCNMDLLAPLSIRPASQASDYHTELRLNDGEKRTINERFRKTQNGDSRPLIFIHPGMGGSALNWPGAFYAQLIENLQTLYPQRYRYIVSHTEGDAPYLKGLHHYLEEKKALPLAQDISFYNGSGHGLRHFIHLLAGARLLVAPATGPTHIANSLGIKQVALYSPLAGERRWMPLRRDENVVVLTPQVECGERARCAGEACSFFECMPKLTVERVTEACQKLLNPAVESTP